MLGAHTNFDDLALCKASMTESINMYSSVYVKSKFQQTRHNLKILNPADHFLLCLLNSHFIHTAQCTAYM